MSLRIRLRRVGRKKQPSYRIVVTDSAVRRDGPYVDDVGFYNPRTKPAELRMDVPKVDAWVAKGATLSDTAASLVRKAKKGGDAKVGYKARGAVEPAVEAAAPEAAAPEAAAPKRAPRKTAKAAEPVAEATPAEPEAAAAEAAPAAAAAPAEEAAE